jgi:hypothetical protein
MGFAKQLQNDTVSPVETLGQIQGTDAQSWISAGWQVGFMALLNRVFSVCRGSAASVEWGEFKLPNVMIDASFRHALAADRSWLIDSGATSFFAWR